MFEPCHPSRAGLVGRVVLALLSAASALGALELGLRRTAYADERWFVWRPGLEHRLEVPPELEHEGRRVVRFRVNSDGLRADELRPDHDLRILCVGGSTTECLVVDQRDAWPSALQSLLQEELPGRRVWVGNSGRSGLNSLDHVVQLERLLPQLEGCDTVLLLAGVNDLTVALSGRAAPSSRTPMTLAERSFEQVPLDQARFGPWFKRTALWRCLRAWKERRLEGGKVQRDVARALGRWRSHRASASARLDRLPPLEQHLAQFARNLERAVAACRLHGARVVLVTQPALWRGDLSAADEARLWMGGVGDFMEQPRCAYYTARALREALDLYNSTVQGVARRTGAQLLDLDARLPRDRSVFYDDVHFHAEGARRVAREAADFLIGQRALESARVDPSAGRVGGG